MAVDEVAEFAEEYNSQLRAMKRPAKEEINALTMVAADYVDNPPFALAVVQVLERCIQEVTRVCPIASARELTLLICSSLARSPVPRPVCCNGGPPANKQVQTGSRKFNLTEACSNVVSCLSLSVSASRAGSQSQNDRKLIPLYVLDSILKNVQPQGAYSALIDKVRAYHLTEPPHSQLELRTDGE